MEPSRQNERSWGFQRFHEPKTNHFTDDYRQLVSLVAIAVAPDNHCHPTVLNHLQLGPAINRGQLYIFSSSPSGSLASAEKTAPGSIPLARTRSSGPLATKQFSLPNSSQQPVTLNTRRHVHPVTTKRITQHSRRTASRRRDANPSVQNISDRAKTAGQLPVAVCHRNQTDESDTERIGYLHFEY
jgi:hypothetical protein